MSFLPLATPEIKLVPLEAHDLRAVLEVLPEIYGAMDMMTFPRASLRILNRFIPDILFSSYNEVDLGSGAARIFCEPPEFEASTDTFKGDLWNYRHQHPMMQRYEKGLDEGVWKISDFLEPEAWHQLELYKRVFIPVNLEDTLSFTLRGSRRLKVFYAINGPRIFTERERTIAATLEPHFVQAFNNAVAFTDARALALLSSRVISESEHHGLLLVDRRGRIIHANERAALHLSKAFTHSDGMTLPADLYNWLQRQQLALDRPHLPFEIEGENSVYVFRSAQADDDHWIVASRQIEEAALCRSLEQSYQITSRQAGVLLWLSRGKSNGEIASILGISERTVAKHLQRTFDRLGVDNRHSATLKVISAIGAP